MNRNQRNTILVKFSARDVSVYVARAPAVKVVTLREKPNIRARILSNADQRTSRRPECCDGFDYS